MLNRCVKDVLRLKLELSEIVLEMMPESIQPVAEKIRSGFLFAVQSAITEFQEGHSGCKGKVHETGLHNIPVK